MNGDTSVAIVGATGAVGKEMVSILEHRGFPLRSLRLLASERSAGVEVPFRGEALRVAALDESALRGVDLALFSAGSGIARRFAPAAAEAGTVVVDNSSAFRMEEGVPLVIPEVNGAALEPVRRAGRGIIANPNCSTILLLVVLSPLRAAFGVERVVVSTYQAASGAGAKGMEELRRQTVEALERMDEDPSPRPSPRSRGEGGRSAARRAVPPGEVFHEPCAFNIFCHDSPVDPETGLNVEERKMIEETRKIWGDPGANVSAMCVRVPVMRAHAESVHVRLSRPASAAEARRVLGEAQGVRVVDDREANDFPTPLKAAGRDEVLVGRMRPDPCEASDDEAAVHGLELFLCGDQLRKGAALNAVQIGEMVFRRG